MNPYAKKVVSQSRLPTQLATPPSLKHVDLRLAQLHEPSSSLAERASTLVWFLVNHRILADAKVVEAAKTFLTYLRSHQQSTDSVIDTWLEFFECCSKYLPGLELSVQKVVLSIITELYLFPRLCAVSVQEDIFAAYSHLLAKDADADVTNTVVALLQVVLTDDKRREKAINAGILSPLLNLLRDADETFAEQIMIIFWEFMHFKQVQQSLLKLGGLQALGSTLHRFRNNIGLVDSALSSLGYATRDDANKEHVREMSILPDVIKCLQIDDAPIQSKAAAVLWNCASNTENKTAIRMLGGVDMLVNLLSSLDENVLETVTGALWNLSVDCMDNVERLENKEYLREIHALKPLLRLCRYTGLVIVENVSGTIWNCATTSANRVELRELQAFPILLNLLDSSEPRVVEHALGTLRNCVINDQNKVVMRELKAFPLIVNFLESSYPAIAEKAASILWICSIEQMNRVEIGSVGMNVLVKCLSSEDSSFVEKIVGIVRNCCSVADMAVEFAQYKGFGPTVRLLHDQYPPIVQELAAATLWTCARNAHLKPKVAAAGAVPYLSRLLSHTKSASVMEQTAGALASLLILDVCKQELLDAGGLETLCLLLSGQNEAVLENVLAAVKNCCAAVDCAEALIRINALPLLLDLVFSKDEAVCKEACLAVRNIATHKQYTQLVGESGGVELLVHLIQTTASPLKRQVGGATLQVLAVNETNRALIEKFKTRKMPWKQQ